MVHFEVIADTEGGVSIRAPREGGDLPSQAAQAVETLFQSAPPVKGAISEMDGYLRGGEVSIRAPREGGDCFRTSSGTNLARFNPRPP